MTQPAEPNTSLQRMPGAAFEQLEIDPNLGVMFAPQPVYERAVRVAQVLVDSKLVPSHLSQQAVFIAVDIALRTKQNPLSVCQSMYEVQGRPGWSSAYLIARARQLGHTIRWDVENLGTKARSWPQKGKMPAGRDVALPNLEVTAYVVEDRDMFARVSMDMAELEGWLANPKYRSMTEHMLRYRAASFLVRQFLPEVLLGLPTAEELASQVEMLEVLEPPMTGGAAIALVDEAPRAGGAALAAALQVPAAQIVTDPVNLEELPPDAGDELGEVIAVQDEEERAREHLQTEISKLKIRLGELDPDAFERARDASGVKTLRKASPLQRFIDLRDACMREIANLEELAAEAKAAEAGDATSRQLKNPTALPMDNSAATVIRFRQNIALLEEAVGDELANKAAARAFDGKRDYIDVDRMQRHDLRSYAQELWALWEDSRP